MYVRKLNIFTVLLCSCLFSINIHSDTAPEQDPHHGIIDAAMLIQQAMDHWRGENSYSEMTMTIQRKDWVRAMSMQAWTEGEKKSLVRVTAPKKDSGNATLINDKDMWSFAPRINRIIKVPSSMMSQSWMGSNFSNKDISRSTEIINHYDHILIGQEQRDGHTVFLIESTPHEEAPVVWGKEVLTIRDDYVLLEQQYWDQDGVLVKVMQTMDFMTVDGREIAKTIRMYDVDTPTEYTEMVNDKVQFDISIAATTFTLSNLRNPR